MAKKTPESVVKRLSKAYHAEKKYKAAKDEARLEFFQTITEGFGTEELAADLVVVDAESVDEALALASAKYPKYGAVVAREHPDLKGKYEVIIEENPEYKAFSIEVDGEVWQRQVSVGSPTIDAEKLETEDPELFEAVTFVPEPERQMKPLAEIDDVNAKKLERYLVPGKVTAKLPAPKKAETE